MKCSFNFISIIGVIFSIFKEKYYYLDWDLNLGFLDMFGHTTPLYYLASAGARSLNQSLY